MFKVCGKLHLAMITLTLHTHSGSLVSTRSSILLPRVGTLTACTSPCDIQNLRNNSCVGSLGPSRLSQLMLLQLKSPAIIHGPLTSKRLLSWSAIAGIELSSGAR